MVQAIANAAKNIVQYENTSHPEVWTDKGLIRLGEIIKDSRNQRRLSLDDMADIVVKRTGWSISKKTLGNIENAVGEPKYNTLAIIAASGIVTDKQGRYLTIKNFMDIASEVDLCCTSTSTQDKIMSLQEMISQAMRDNDIPQEAVEASLIQQALMNIGNISLEKFKAIQSGAINRPSVEELRLIMNAVDPNQEIFSWWDWEAHAETEAPTQHWQGQKNNHLI